MKNHLSICFLTILFFLTHFQSFSQTKTYYTKDNQKTQKDSAYYYRLENFNEAGRVNGQVQEFYMDSTLKMMGHYFNGKKDGDFIYYYPSGKMKEMASYKIDVPVGKLKNWYPNGKKQVEFLIEKEKQYILNAWDTTGRQIVSEGTGDYVEYDYENKFIREKGKLLNLNKVGTWQAWFDNNRLFYSEEYENGVLVKGVFYDLDDKSYEYTIIEEQPIPDGGLKGFYQYISQTLVYPKVAKRNGIEGRVFVQFYVSENGKLTDVKVIKGLGGGCDEEAIRLIKEAPAWIPGKQRGKIVKVKISLPIEFKLK